MQVLIQRVLEAQVRVSDNVIGEIGPGLLLLLGVEKTDSGTEVEKLANKVLNYRIFSDKTGQMNESLLDVGGELLVISQFTMAANTKKGLRPSFSSAAPAPGWPSGWRLGLGKWLHTQASVPPALNGLV